MAQDPVSNIGYGLTPGHPLAMGIAGRISKSRRNRYDDARQFRDDERLVRLRAQLQGDLMSHGKDLEDYAKRREHGVDTDEELQAIGGHAGARIASEGRATMEHVVNPMVEASKVEGGARGFTMATPGGIKLSMTQHHIPKAKGKGKNKAEEAPAAPGRVAPENERPTHMVREEDTNPNASRQFGDLSSAQELYNLRTSPEGKMTKAAGQARAKAWGPLSEKDKEMDARTAAPVSEAPKKTKTQKVAKAAKVAGTVAKVAEEII